MGSPAGLDRTQPTELPKLNIFELKPNLKVTLVRDSDGLAALQDFFNRKKVFGYDLETNVVSDFTARKIRTMQFGDRDEQFIIDLLAFAGSTENLMKQGDRQAPDWAKPVIDVVQPALESDGCLKIGHNLAFEYRTSRWCLGLKPWNLWDTQEIEKVLYCGKVGFFEPHFWGLEDLVRRYCRVITDKTHQTSFDLESPLTQEQIEYAALDTRMVCAIQKAQNTSVLANGLDRVAYIENNAIPAFGEMYLNGIYLDRAAWMAIIATTEERHKQNVKALDRFFIPVVGHKDVCPVDNLDTLEDCWRSEKDRVLRAEFRVRYTEGAKKVREWKKLREDCEGEALINYGSNPQLLAAFRKMGFGPKALPDTNDRTLSLLACKHPVIKALQDFRTSQKQLTTYGVDFLKHINEHTGRVHSNIAQLGAATGRTSSSSPNIQNIPRGSDYRGAFRTRPGYVFISVDMSGAELRILAEASGDPIMIEAFANGWDVHSVGAEIIFGDLWRDTALPDCAYYTKDHKKCKCPRHKELRDQIKNINFGICYGMEAKKLSDDLGISIDEAKLLLDKWRKAFKVAWAYLTNSGNAAKMKLAARTLAGRVRYFKEPNWNECAQAAAAEAAKKGKTASQEAVSRMYHGKWGNIEREGKNTPIQGTNADIIKLAMGTGKSENGALFLWHLLWKYDAILVNMVHDELDLEVKEGQEQEVIAAVGDCYRRAAAAFMKKVEMLYEATVGDRWQK